MRNLILLIIIFSPFFLNAASSITPQQLIDHKGWSFVENKGQLFDENHKVVKNVKYYSHEGNINLYCKSGMISFVFKKIENEARAVSEATATFSGFPLTKPDRMAGPGRGAEGFGEKKICMTSRMDLLLINANPNAAIIATDQQPYYENYYNTGDANHGISNVHSYKTVIYQNIYRNIDMILTIKKKEMEYSFLVHPGGRVKDIKLRWNGIMKSESMDNGGLRYSTTLGRIEESAPKSFVDGEIIESKILKKGSDYSFHVDWYDKTKDLIIDPTLAFWATYFGGINEDQGRCIATDATGNIYVAGYSLSSNGIASAGAYQTSYGGGSFGGYGDAILMKFNNAGGLDWATYFGGSDDDQGAGVTIDANGNVFLAGATASSGGIATSGAYQTSLAGGGDDAFLAKFSSLGKLTWATYFGGSKADLGKGVSIDGSGNAFLTGNTESTSGIATSGAFQTSFSGGFGFEVFLAKFTNDGVLTFSTYYGGSGLDNEVNGITTDGSGNMYITGRTTGSSGIATTGANQTLYGGGNYDAFLSKFNNSGILSWGTYFGGFDDDEGFGINIDISGNIYITGSSKSMSGIATSGAFQTSFAGGNNDGFLAKFNSAGVLSWATYFGSTGDDVAVGVSTDGADVYIGGSTSSSTGIATLGAYQSSLRGSYDAFLAKFSSSGSEIWATYYGGTDVEAIIGVSCDASGNAYITGYTGSSNGISTPNAYQTTYGGGNSDAFIAKFPPNPFSGINSATISDDYNLSISPNPFQNETSINFSLIEPSLVNISIMDMVGRIIFTSASRKLNVGENKIFINALEMGLSPGSYFINLIINDQVINKKIIEIR